MWFNNYIYKISKSKHYLNNIKSNNLLFKCHTKKNSLLLRVLDGPFIDSLLYLVLEIRILESARVVNLVCPFSILEK